MSAGTTSVGNRLGPLALALFILVGWTPPNESPVADAAQAGEKPCT